MGKIKYIISNTVGKFQHLEYTVLHFGTEGRANYSQRLFCTESYLFHRLQYVPDSWNMFDIMTSVCMLKR